MVQYQISAVKPTINGHIGIINHITEKSLESAMGIVNI